MLTRSELPLILLVDDDPDALALTAELLESLFNIKTAGSGHEALGTLEETPLPDIVIADILVLAVLGKLSDGLLKAVERRALAWRDSFEGLEGKA